MDLFFFVGPRFILWGHWYPRFRTSDDSVHEFQSQGGFIVTCALLSGRKHVSMRLDGHFLRPTFNPSRVEMLGSVSVN